MSFSETQIYRTVFWTLWEKARVGCFRRTASKHVYYLGWNRSPAQVGCMRQAFGPDALGKPRGRGWRGRWEGGSGWGTHVNPWLFHFNVWQNSLQIKKIIIKKKKRKKKELQFRIKKKNQLALTMKQIRNVRIPFTVRKIIQVGISISDQSSACQVRVTSYSDRKCAFIYCSNSCSLTKYPSRGAKAFCMVTSEVQDCTLPK